MLIIELESFGVDTGERAPTAGALRAGGGAVAFADGDVIVWNDAGAATSARVAFVPAALCVSNDGRFVGAISAARDRFVVIDLERGADCFTVDAPNPRRQPLVATFASGSAGPVAILSRRPGELELFDPRSGATSSRPLATFRVTALQPLALGRSIGLIGHFDGETKDSFAVAVIDDVVASPAALDAQLRAKTGVAEYAYRVALGPYGRDAVVAARDPEDDEEEPDADGGPLYGLRGIYTRMVDGTVNETMHLDAELPAGERLCGDAGVVAWADGNEVRVARLSAPSGEAVGAAATWLAPAPDGSAVLVTTPRQPLARLRWRPGD